MVARKRRFAVMSSCPESWGGSEELWFGTCLALRALGHDVLVLKRKLDDDHPRVIELRAAGVRVAALDRHAGARWWLALSAVLPRRVALDPARQQMVTAAPRLAAMRPDAVIISQGENFDGLFLAEMCRRLRLPFIVVSQKAAELRWPTDALRPYLASVLNHAQPAVFVSEHNRRLTEEMVGEPLTQAVVLPNPLIAGRGGPLPWPAPAPDGALRLACVGRLFLLDKGQDLLVRALAQDRWRERPIELTFVGTGTNGASIEHLADRLDVRRVTFAGHTTDIEGVWRQHHALVLASRSEGLPLAALEAMACGRPAILTDVGGNADLVDDGRTGFLAASASVEAIDDALERAWQARDRWEQIGLDAAREVQTRFDQDPVGDLAAMALALPSRRRLR